MSVATLAPSFATQPPPAFLLVPTTPPPPWHAIFTRPNKEFEVSDEASTKFNLEVYCPHFPATWVHRGRRYTRTFPYIRSWVFARFPADDADLWHALHDVAGVRGFLGGPTPSPIPDEDIERLRARLDESWDHQPTSHSFNQGDIIRFVDGPWQGYEGPVTAVNQTTSHVWVKITLLGREVDVPCAAGWCEPTKQDATSDDSGTAQNKKRKRGRRGGSPHKSPKYHHAAV